ncbi:MAG: LysR family transcriptional regulator [Sphingobium sp.]|jgi:DNA-binding transcriptional LysR family regulator|nr:LysR family transcriptional regulator [Sphingobium sp.]MCI2052812.1 LysR family transcriptional regulator [Sphingobium sp.]
MISRQQIRQFLAVVDAGNFSRAAAAIGLTQPTLSAAINELERQIGARLFIREKRAIRLTAAGSRLLPLARNIDRDFRLAEQETARTPALRPFARIGIIPSLADHVVQRLVAELQRAHLIEVQEGRAADLERGLLSGKLDAAISLVEPGIADRQRATPLYTEPYRLLLPANHELAGQPLVNAVDLANQPMIARRSCELLGRTSQFFTERGVRPPFSFKSHNDQRAITMVAAGIGATVAPATFHREGVAQLDMQDFDFQRTVAFLLPASRSLAKESEEALLSAAQNAARTIRALSGL